MTLAACARPLASIMMRSGSLRNSLANALPICGPAAQQRQPPAISATGMPSSLNTAPSMPISPNSLTNITHFSFGSFCAIRLFSAVVLPVPKKPEIRWTLVFFIGILRRFLSVRGVFRSARSLCRRLPAGGRPIAGSGIVRPPRRIRCRRG